MAVAPRAPAPAAGMRGGGCASLGGGNSPTTDRRARANGPVALGGPSESASLDSDSDSDTADSGFRVARLPFRPAATSSPSRLP